MSVENKGIKRKLEESSDECIFEIKGHCTDEVEFQFEDDTKLYASKNLLGYASPVFKAMFEHDFKEAEESTVVIDDCSREEFLEFLLYLKPGTNKPVNEKKYIKTVRIADKYQCEGLIQRFQRYMKEQIKRATETCNEKSSMSLQSPHALTCLRILQTANALSYEDICTTSIDAVARFSPGLYMYDECNWSFSCQDNTKLIEIFSELPSEIKYAVSLERMQLIRVHTFK